MKIALALRPMMSSMGLNNCPYEAIPGIIQKRNVQSFVNNDIVNNKIGEAIKCYPNTDKNQRKIVD
jgi:hypothetical protein